MNRLLILSVLALVTVLPASAQWEARIHAGVSSFSLYGDSENDFNGITRFFGGAGVAFPVRGNFFTRIEANYMIRGAEVQDALIAEIGTPIDAEFEIAYVEIPLLLAYRFDRARRLRPSVYGGISVSRNVEARVKFTASEGGPVFEETDDSIEKNDMGAVFGAEVALPFAGDRLLVGLRGYVGFSNVRDTDPALRNGGALAYVGVSF